MECSVVQSKFGSLLKGTIKGNELRKVYYHIVKCKTCKEILLDEFSFYTTFNDLDKDLNFNYEKKLDEFLSSIRLNIETKDSDRLTKYILMSVCMCIMFVVLIALAVRIVYI